MQTSRDTSFKDHVASRRKRSTVTFGELIKRTQEGLSDQDKKELAELEQQLSQVEHDPYSPVTILRQMDASLRWETWVELTYGDDVNPWSKDVFVKKNFTSYAVMRALAGKGSGKISSTLQITTLLNEFKYILAQGKKEGLTIEAGLFSSFKSKCFGLIQAGLLSNEGRPKCVVGFKDTQRTEVVISPPCRLVQYHFQ